jgi:thiol-disulfide isomerase/thioredoxin
MLLRLISIGFILSACTAAPPLTVDFALSGGDSATFAESLAGYNATVLVFLSPECPLCKNYAPTLREIAALAHEQNIGMIGAVSGNFHSDTAITRYLQQYELAIPVLLDPNFLLSKYYNATITPEVCLIDPEGELLYRGAIDNWAISLGQKRQVITEHYLRDAITAFAERRTIDPKTTKAVGCFIE